MLSDWDVERMFAARPLFVCLLFLNVNPKAHGTVVNEGSEKPPGSLSVLKMFSCCYFPLDSFASCK